MFDQYEDESVEDDYYGDIPEEAFFYEESAYKYGFQLGQREAEDGIDSESALDNFPYPTDADPSMIEVFRNAYLDAVDKYNNDFADDEDEWN